MDQKEKLETFTPKVARFLATGPAGAGDWTSSIVAAALRFGIDTEQRLAMFLAQVVHESRWFQELEENLNYSAERLLQVFPRHFSTPAEAAAYAHRPEKIANRVYANRMGNGPEVSGDGWKYRGRGPLQWTGEANLSYRVTGREAYEVQGKEQGQPILDNPELLTKPGPGCFWAAWWWANHGLNAIADTGDLEQVTRVINGGTIGIEGRRELYEKATSFMAGKPSDTMSQSKKGGTKNEK